jgi:hypothetical protein
MGCSTVHAYMHLQSTYFLSIKINLFYFETNDHCYWSNAFLYFENNITDIVLLCDRLSDIN